jgi:hypothetical protein
MEGTTLPLGQVCGAAKYVFLLNLYVQAAQKEQQ